MRSWNSRQPPPPPLLLLTSGSLLFSFSLSFSSFPPLLLPPLLLPSSLRALTGALLPPQRQTGSNWRTWPVSSSSTFAVCLHCPLCTEALADTLTLPTRPLRGLSTLGATCPEHRKTTACSEEAVKRRRRRKMHGFLCFLFCTTKNVIDHCAERGNN